MATIWAPTHADAARNLMAALPKEDPFLSTRFDVAIAIAELGVCGSLRNWIGFDENELFSFLESSGAGTSSSSEVEAVSVRDQILDALVALEPTALAKLFLDGFNELDVKDIRPTKKRREYSPFERFGEEIMRSATVVKRHDVVDALLDPASWLPASSDGHESYSLLVQLKHVQSFCARVVCGGFGVGDATEDVTGKIRGLLAVEGRVTPEFVNGCSRGDCKRVELSTQQHVSAI